MGAYGPVAERIKVHCFFVKTVGTVPVFIGPVPFFFCRVNAPIVNFYPFHYGTIGGYGFNLLHYQLKVSQLGKNRPLRFRKGYFLQFLALKRGFPVPFLKLSHAKIFRLFTRHEQYPKFFHVHSKFETITFHKKIKMKFTNKYFHFL